MYIWLWSGVLMDWSAGNVVAVAKDEASAWRAVKREDRGAYNWLKAEGKSPNA